MNEKDNVLIQKHERVDDLHRDGLLLIQDPGKFCFGIDAVLLSNFAKVKKGEISLDLGTGTGVIPILLMAKNNGKAYYGVEIQKPLVEMAKRSVLLNKLDGIVTISYGDIKDLTQNYKPSSFDVITCNPPYTNYGGGIINEDNAKAVSRHEILCTLEDVVSCAAKYLKTNGRFYMVHRPHRLVDVVCMLRKKRLEPKKIRFVHSYAHKEPTMFLIEAVYGGKPMVKILPPLVIYKEDLVYTGEIFSIYYE